MKIAQTVAEVLNQHVRMEVECIDRMYLNVYMPQLQHVAGVVKFFRYHRKQSWASSALMAPISRKFVESIERFIETQVHEAAEALSAAISEIPPTAHEKVEEWPAWPFLKLHIPLHESTRISKLEVSAALPELLRHTVVAATDMVALMILGLRKLPEQETLESIVARIRERSGTIDDRWVTSLVSQMHRALQREFTEVDWSLFRGTRDKPGEWFSPIVGWVRRIPYDNIFELHLFLLPFASRVSTGTHRIHWRQVSKIKIPGSSIGD